MLRSLSVCALAIATACSSRLPGVPSNAFVGASRPLPTPRVETNESKPQILAMRFSSLDIARGQNWSGEFVTSTDVASVEVRTSLFSIDVPRQNFGKFAFTVDVLDVPPIFVRPYNLRVLARNAAGVPDEEDLPFRIR